MWGVVAWEKQPGGRDSNNPDASKKSRPTLGMPILLDMKKKPGADQLGRPSLQRQGRPDLLFLDHAVGCGSSRNPRLRAGLPLRRRDLDARRAADPVEPGQQHGEGAPREGRNAEDGAPTTGTAPKTTGSIRRAEEAGRSGRRYLPTRRRRAACPLAPAGTAAPRRASSPATAPAACPCSTCRDGSTATGCRTRSQSSAR